MTLNTGWRPGFCSQHESNALLLMDEHHLGVLAHGAVQGTMCEVLLEAVCGLRLANPDLSLKPLLAKLRQQQVY